MLGSFCFLQALVILAQRSEVEATSQNVFDQVDIGSEAAHSIQLFTSSLENNGVNTSE